MNYRKMTADDAGFLTKLFSVPEYDLYFAENDTSAEDWKERILRYYNEKQSLIIVEESKDIGWLMYDIQEQTCIVDIIVLLPDERYHGYGKTVMADLVSKNAQIKKVQLDVQQRNTPAILFYKNLGFAVVSEEVQPVNGEPVTYYNMELSL